MVQLGLVERRFRRLEDSKDDEPGAFTWGRLEYFWHRVFLAHSRRHPILWRAQGTSKLTKSNRTKHTRAAIRLAAFDLHNKLMTE